ncbi:hypothetical protein CEXT_478561 [Caerostris extrusa]|uniref:Uncharacterized protein n=1 Tax=Caerostris extrusa TaxID=172846 RepID=A0AAV4Y1B8_CAEEX|nr:hypothetical protein CEXT_478561 [Caerostris extrusa]
MYSRKLTTRNNICFNWCVFTDFRTNPLINIIHNREGYYPRITTLLEKDIGEILIMLVSGHMAVSLSSKRLKSKLESALPYNCSESTVVAR